VMAMMTLLMNNADPAIVNSIGWDALTVASMMGHADAANLVISKGADVNRKDKEGKGALMHAAQLGRLDVVKILLKRKADANAVDDRGMTAITMAQSNLKYEGHDDMVRVLCESLDTSERLWEAAMQGDGDGIAKALAEGAPVNAVDERAEEDWDHMPALLRAAEARDSTACVQQLLAAKADATYVNPKGVTALMQAASGGKVGTIEAVFSASLEGSLAAADSEGEDALMYAAGQGGRPAVELLLQLKADPTRKNNAGQSAADVAAKAGNGKTATVLREASGEPQPEKKAALKPDDPMAKDGWLGSANLTAQKQGGAVPRQQKKKSKKKK